MTTFNAGDTVRIKQGCEGFVRTSHYYRPLVEYIGKPLVIHSSGINGVVIFLGLGVTDLNHYSPLVFELYSTNEENER